jgi:hypothetical protein
MDEVKKIEHYKNLNTDTSENSAIGSHLALNSGINNATSSPFSFQF